MIRVDEHIWIGTSQDEIDIVVKQSKSLLQISAVLNVANDLIPTVLTQTKRAYMWVGLIDGPGNTQAAYSAAIMALSTLLERHKDVLICCHSGSRSLAVAIMYLIIKAGMNSESSTFFNYWTPWDKMVEDISNKAQKLLLPHPAHKEVFDKMPLSLLEQLI